MELTKRFLDKLKSNEVVPFIGAGFSVPSGAISWKELLEIMVNQNVADPDAFLNTDLDLIDLAEHFDSLQISELAFYETASGLLDNKKLKPNKYHNALSEINFSTYVTTNWDTLLESTFETAEIDYHKFHNDDGVTFYNPSSKVQLIKLHGDITIVKSLVYKKSHYSEFWEKRRILEALITTLTTTKSFLFLGYGLGDPNIRDLLRTVKQRTSNTSREHYALVYGKDDNLYSFWKDLGVQTILAPNFDSKKKNYEESTILFLELLKNSSKKTTMSNLERSKFINEEISQLTLERKPSSCLRMRGALGWLSNPVPDDKNFVYGSLEQDCEERKMTELIYDFLSKSTTNKVLCILHLNTEPLKSKYTSGSLIKRLEMIKESLVKFSGQIEIVHNYLPSHSNQMIINDNVILFGDKQMHIGGILRVSITRNKVFVNNEIERFDHDFKDIAQKNIEGGTPLKEYISTMLSGEIEKLKSQFNYQKIDLLSKALTFAILKHHEHKQTREDGLTPYGVHLIRVVSILQNISKATNYEVLISGALHDILEDTDVSYDKLRSDYGEQVAINVFALSIAKGSNFDQYLLQLKKASKDVQRIKLADKLDNVNDLIRFKKLTFGTSSSKIYLKEAEAVLDICKDGCPILAVELKNSIEKAIKIFS